MTTLSEIVPVAVSVKSPAVAVPPLSLTTTLRRCNCPCVWLVYVQTTLSPSLRTIDTVAVVVVGGAVD